LTRTAFGPVALKNLQVGTARELTDDELGALLDSVQL
jgi:16S rRNA U516 pseudouridylate synthase RsuA-like enzyme